MKPVEMDKIYREKSLENIPWNYEKPPSPLVDLIENGKINPSTAIDLGCGLGNYAIYLANKGFKVTGIDLSPTAIENAKKKANEKGVKCKFLVANVLYNLNEIDQTFNFAYDWEVLHHIFPENREIYVKNVHKLLNPKGKYLSVCFSEADPCFGGKEKYRTTPLGTILYFSSEDELRALFKKYFKIEELKTIEIRGKPVSHYAIYAFMERK